MPNDVKIMSIMPNDVKSIYFSSLQIFFRQHFFLLLFLNCNESDI